jgi:hypothetical protein
MQKLAYEGVEEGTFPSGIQSDAQFSKLPRNTFVLPLTGLSPETMQKIESMSAKDPHKGYPGIGSGFKLGWILWKDISAIIGEPSILIEQAQSDISGLIMMMENPKFDITKDTFVERGQNEDPAVRELKQLRQKFPSIIGHAFESKAAGKKLFMTGIDKIMELTGLRPDTNRTGFTPAYKELAKVLKMHPSTKLPGYLER